MKTQPDLPEMPTKASARNMVRVTFCRPGDPDEWKEPQFPFDPDREEEAAKWPKPTGDKLDGCFDTGLDSSESWFECPLWFKRLRAYWFGR